MCKYIQTWTVQGPGTFSQLTELYTKLREAYEKPSSYKSSRSGPKVLADEKYTAYMSLHLLGVLFLLAYNCFLFC